MLKRTSEEKQNPTEMDIREKINAISHSPVLQQEYLENLLKRIAIQPSIKIFASRILADVYARRGMWASAAKTMENAASTFLNPNTKRDIYKQAAVLYLKAMDLLMAEDCFRKAIENSMEKEKPFLKKEIEQMHLAEAANMENNGKRARAVEVYERMLRLNPDPLLQRRIQERLVVLYEKLGRIADHLTLRDSLMKK